MRIAVVDDRADERAEIVSLIEEYLARVGVTGAVCREFASAEEFASALGEQSFDVAVLDIIMGEMDGMEAARAARGAAVVRDHLRHFEP